jgi:hypothetical protein
MVEQLQVSSSPKWRQTHQRIVVVVTKKKLSKFLLGGLLRHPISIHHYICHQSIDIINEIHASPITVSMEKSAIVLITVNSRVVFSAP